MDVSTSRKPSEVRKERMSWMIWGGNVEMGYFGASVEDVARVLADEEVEVALGVRESREKADFSVFYVGIFEFVPLARDRPETWSEQGDLLGENAQLAHVGAARNAVDADHVAGTEIFVDVLEMLFFLFLTGWRE